jgi:hypothetical protein
MIIAPVRGRSDLAALRAKPVIMVQARGARPKEAGRPAAGTAGCGHG